MCLNFSISPRVYNALLNVDVETFSKLPNKEIRPALPALVRLSLISPTDMTAECQENRKRVLTLLADIEAVNSLISLLSVDFHGLEIDVKQEQAMRKKLSSVQGDSLIAQSENGLALRFERSDSTRRLRLVLGEMLFTSLQMEYYKNAQEFFIKSSDLFDNAVYIPEVCDVLNVALAELPGLLTIHDAVQILLHLKHGPDIICCIAANYPAHFNDICVSIISNSERIEDDNGGSRIRMIALTNLCKMNPPAAYFVRLKCVELNKLPALTVTLTLNFPNCFWRRETSSFESRGGDIVPFVSGLLLGTDQQLRNWFHLFIRTRPKKTKEYNTAVHMLREELLYQLKCIVEQTENNFLPHNCVVYSSVLLKLYSALRGIVGIKFQEEEVSLLISLVTVYPPATAEGVRLGSIAVCMLFTCPSLIGHPENEIRCTQWLKWLSGTESPFFGKPTDVTTSFSEMLLLLAIHLHGNQLTAVGDLVCSTLGMKVSLRGTNNLSKIRSIFVQEVFTEQVVTSRAVNVLVTPNLNANITGFLPIHCILQLMRSRAFAKYKVNVKDWIYKQICASVAPLHPLLPPLIEVYVNSMLNVPKTPHEFSSNEPITEEEILTIFNNYSVAVSEGKHIEKNLMPQLLLLYYVLLYEDVRLSNTQSYISYGRQVKSYSPEFLAEFPIRYLLQQAQKDQQCYAGLFSSLLRLLLTHFPHLALVEDWLEEEPICSGGVAQKTVSVESLSQGLRQMAINPSQASRLLNALLAMPLTQLWPYVPTFVSYMRSTLDENVPRYVQELYKRVWLRCNSLLPRRLWTMTVSSLSHEDASLPDMTFRDDSGIIDPLQILRCDYRVFRCAPVLSIVIRILQSFLASSRIQLSRHLQDTPFPRIFANPNYDNAGLTNDVERDDLKTALVAAQESTAIQVLLEECLENENDRMSVSKVWTLREIRSIICSYLHQVFIAEPPLAKLVHFQGYSDDLLPVTVRGVPSMHICIDFIGELIAQPCLEKQAFAVNLTSFLCLQYSLPHSMMVAKFVVSTLNSLSTALPAASRIELFIPALPALVRICMSFPPLVDDVFTLLIQLGKITAAEISLKTTASSYNMIQADDDYFKRYKSDITNPSMSNHYLYWEVQRTFTDIVSEVVLNRKLY